MWCERRRSIRYPSVDRVWTDQYQTPPVSRSPDLLVSLRPIGLISNGSTLTRTSGYLLLASHTDFKVSALRTLKQVGGHGVDLVDGTKSQIPEAREV